MNRKNDLPLYRNGKTYFNVFGTICDTLEKCPERIDELEEFITIVKQEIELENEVESSQEIKR